MIEAPLIAAAMRDHRATILKNVRLEVDALQRESHERLQGRYNPGADAKAALQGVNRLAAAVEALAMVIEHAEPEC